jgi:hypothetical protein
VRHTGVHGVLKLRFEEGRSTWEFLTTGGYFQAKGEGACH